MPNNIIAQVSGGERQILDGVSTVGECRAKLGLDSKYQGQIDGVAAKDDAPVRAGNFVTFAEQVKGA